ncbi:MAG: MFS transporter [Pseudomonadota bacterium]
MSNSDLTGSAPDLNFSTKLSFGIGQIAEGVKTCAFGTYLLFYYNQVLGLSGDLAGLAIFIALVFDAITDPIAGSVSDRWRSPMGRRHPFMYASALPLAISFGFLFAPLVSIDSVGEGGLFAWMAVFTVLTRASMTLYHVPHMALGAELSEDYDERTVLVAMRHFFGAVGFMATYAIGFGYFFLPTPEYANGQLNPDVYPSMAIWLGVVMAVTIFWTGWGTRKRVPHMPKPAQLEGEQRVTVRDVLSETYQAMQNVSFRWIMFGFILVIAAWAMAGVVGIYVYTFFWELDNAQILFVLLLGPIGSMFGYPFSKIYYAWLDKRNAMIVAAIYWMIIHSIPVLLFLAGMAPEGGTWSAAIFMGVFSALGGLGVGQVVVGIGTVMADIADENELDTGLRQEGVFFGASAFANKCSAGLGNLIAGFVLEWIDWPVGENVRTAADIPSDTLIQLAVIAGPVIALLALPGALCFRGYRLDRSRVQEIQAQLHAGAS